METEHTERNQYYFPEKEFVSILRQNSSGKTIMLNIIGGFDCYEKYSDYGEVVSIYFLPDYIGQGYGRQLLNKCIEELKRCGFKKVLLWVLENNHRARKFYEKNGFIYSEIFMEDNIGGKDIREVLYFLV